MKTKQNLRQSVLCRLNVVDYIIQMCLAQLQCFPVCFIEHLVAQRQEDQHKDMFLTFSDGVMTLLVLVQPAPFAMSKVFTSAANHAPDPQG